MEFCFDLKSCFLFGGGRGGNRLSRSCAFATSICCCFCCCCCSLSWLLKKSDFPRCCCSWSIGAGSCCSCWSSTDWLSRRRASLSFSLTSCCRLATGSGVVTSCSCCCFCCCCCFFLTSSLLSVISLSLLSPIPLICCCC